MLPTIAWQGDDEVWGNFVRYVLKIALFNTVSLLAGVAIIASIAGVGTAWLVTAYDFPGRNAFVWLLPLPLAFPTYIVAYVYVDLLDGVGPVQTALRAMFGWHTAADYWFPSVRTLGGAVLGSRDYILDRLQPIIRNTGPSLSPFNAWVFVKGMETLGLRVERHCANARKVADALAANPRISRVLYPGRPDHPQHKLAASQMSNFGGVVTFDVKGGKDAAWKVIDSTRMISITANLGDTKSTITHPATTTHSQLNDEELVSAGVTPETVRLSVGIEDPSDLIKDIDQALAKATA